MRTLSNKSHAWDSSWTQSMKILWRIEPIAKSCWRMYFISIPLPRVSNQTSQTCRQRLKIAQNGKTRFFGSRHDSWSDPVWQKPSFVSTFLFPIHHFGPYSRQLTTILIFLSSEKSVFCCIHNTFFFRFLLWTPQYLLKMFRIPKLVAGHNCRYSILTSPKISLILVTQLGTRLGE